MNCSGKVALNIFMALYSPLLTFAFHNGLPDPVDFWYDSLVGGSVQSQASTDAGQHNTEKRRHTSMPRAGLETAISISERPKTVLASDARLFSLAFIKLRSVILS